jgi:ABC-type polysaccharide/polyol phosphate export permease
VLNLVNPVTPPLVASREWLAGGATYPGEMMWVVIAASSVLLVAGWVLFRLALPHLVDRVGL